MPSGTTVCSGLQRGVEGGKFICLRWVGSSLKPHHFTSMRSHEVDPLHGAFQDNYGLMCNLLHERTPWDPRYSTFTDPALSADSWPGSVCSNPPSALFRLAELMIP